MKNIKITFYACDNFDLALPVPGCNWVRRSRCERKPGPGPEPRAVSSWNPTHTDILLTRPDLTQIQRSLWGTEGRLARGQGYQGRAQGQGARVVGGGSGRG